MKYEITDDRKKLTLTIDPEEQAALQLTRTEEPDDWGTTTLETDFLEPLICNSELEWIDPADTGDLTDAPMLGICDEEENILERWAFMDYQVRSFLDDLADHGKATFIS
jgi:hypothetical protein